MKKRIKYFFSQGHERTLKAKKNILLMFFLKGISIALSLIIVPLTINYVSPYQYGIWLTISSLIAWLSFFDIGLGNGLRNKFIQAISLGKNKLAKIYVSTTYCILAIIILAVWLLFSVIVYFIDWSALLKVPSEMDNELTFVAFIILTNFSFTFVLKMIVTLINAIQKPALASLFDTLSQILVAIFIILLRRYTDGSLVYLAIALCISQTSVLFLGSLWMFSHELKLYRPSLKFVRFRMANGLLTLGIKFFVLQIIAIIIYQTNNIIITRILGPTEVSVYNVAYKYLFVINMIFAIILAPFWSAFVEANTLQDYNWMKQVTKKLRLIFLAVSFGGIIMVGVSPFVYKVWIGDSVSIPFIVTLLLCFYHIVNTWGGLHTQLLAGFGKIKLQMIFSCICGSLNIPIGVILCKFFGLPGLIFGNIFVLIIFNSWFGFIQVNRILNKTAKGIWNE